MIGRRDRLGRTVYILGPAVLTVIMVMGSAAYQPLRHYDSWPVYPILIGGLIVALWHSVLIMSESRKAWYISYALVNIVLYVILGFIGLMMVTGDSL